MRSNSRATTRFPRTLLVSCSEACPHVQERKVALMSAVFGGFTDYAYAADINDDGKVTRMKKAPLSGALHTSHWPCILQIWNDAYAFNVMSGAAQ